MTEAGSRFPAPVPFPQPASSPPGRALTIPLSGSLRSLAGCLSYIYTTLACKGVRIAFFVCFRMVNANGFVYTTQQEQ